MKAICIDSEGSWVSNYSFGNTGLLNELERIARATESDFKTLPVLSKGFYDSHAHPIWMAKLKNQIDCKNKSAVDILEEIKNSPLHTIYGFGWSEENLKCPTDEFKRLLDSCKKQIFLYRTCGHMAYASHYGFLKEKELAQIPRIPLHAEDLKKVLSEMKKAGITDTADLCVWADDYTNASENNLRLFGDVKDVDKYLKLEEKLRPPYMKFFLDGSLGARTAWLSEAYSDDSKNFGIQMWSDETLHENILLCLKNGFSLAFHAIGDAALDQLLRVSDKLSSELKKNYSEVYPYRIEHLQVCRDDQIEKLTQNNLWSLGLQPSHRVADLSFSQNRLGKQRLEKNAYRLKSFVDAGLKVSLGSDAPIVSYEPLKTFSAIQSDGRKHETLSILETYEFFCVKSRQNSGISAKKLLGNSEVHISTLHL